MTAFASLLGRRAHLPVGPGPAERGWGYTRWGLVGQTPSISIYDADFGPSGSKVHRSYRGGVVEEFDLPGPREPTMTRTGLVSAQLSSLRAARFFNPLGGASGTGRSESGGTAAHSHNRLGIDFNQNAQGAAELHPATTYDPLPTPGNLYPKVV